MTVPLATHRGIPPGLLDCPAAGLEAALGRSSLLHLPGAREPALFVSVLLHGNETSGWEGLRRYLRETPELPRSLVVFIGNVSAAAAGMRVLPEQQDFNRIWRNARGHGAALAAALQAALADVELFAAVDLHNNTGHNPFYSVLTDLDDHNFGLAYLFSEKAVYIREPDTTLTQWFAGRCPSVAFEVGPVGDPRCDDRVADFLARCLELDAVPSATSGELELFRALARVHVRRGVEFSFAGEDETAPLVLTGGMEAVNFHDLEAGTRFGASELDLEQVLEVLDPEHAPVTEQYLEKLGPDIVLKAPIVPAMYTTDPYVIGQDCLCYFMERMRL